MTTIEQRIRAVEETRKSYELFTDLERYINTRFDQTCSSFDEYDMARMNAKRELILSLVSEYRESTWRLLNAAKRAMPMSYFDGSMR